MLYITLPPWYMYAVTYVRICTCMYAWKCVRVMLTIDASLNQILNWSKPAAA